jgi:hypothetical protein
MGDHAHLATGKTVPHRAWINQITLNLPPA